MIEVKIKDEYITLGQMIKYENLIESGGMLKFFLESVDIKVNGVFENRRGKKLYRNDVIEIENIDTFTII